MKILSLSSDNSILNKDSRSAARTIEYGELVDQYTVLVLTEKDCKLFLSGKVNVNGIESGDRYNILNRLSGIIKLYKAASRILNEEKHDVITVQDPFEYALVGWLLKKKFKVGLNIQEHGDFFSGNYWRNENFLNFIRYYLGIFLIKKADSIRTVSLRIKKTLSEKFGVDENKIITVPIFTNKADRETESNYDGLREQYRGKFIFLTMGRIVKQKNLSLLIRAFRQVADKYSEAILVIVGSGSQKHNMKNLVFELELTDKVEFFEWTDDVYAWYETADAYVLSSDYEGWAMVIIEAASCALPIIMTDVGCAGEVIKNGESGLVLPIGNEEKLAEAMMKVKTDDELRKKIGKNARIALLSLPTKEETLKLYKKSWAVAANTAQI